MAEPEEIDRLKAYEIFRRGFSGPWSLPFSGLWSYKVFRRLEKGPTGK